MNSSRCSPTAPSQARLQEAISDGRIFQTKQLIEGGVEVNFADEEGLSPLLRVCMIEDAKHRTRTSLLKLLLQHGADVNSTDTQGRNVLAWVCAHGKEDIVRLLLTFADHEIDLNEQDVQGNTPLMQAVKSGNTNIVKLVLEALKKYRIDIDVRNHDDRTPYLEAKRLGYEDCAEVLLREGNASKNIQVNPFLDFMDDDQDRVKGGIRGVETGKVVSTGRAVKEGSHNSVGRTKVVRQDVKRPLKRKLVGSKRGPRNLKHQSGLPAPRQHAWDDTKTPQSSSAVKTKINPTTEEALSHERVMQAGISTDNSLTHKTPGSPRQTRSFLSVDEFRVYKPLRPFTAQPCARPTNLDKAVSTPDLHGPGPDKGTTTNPEGKRPMGRPKTGINRSRPNRERTFSLGSSTMSDASFDTESVASWYSHFSLRTSPSITFIQRLMALYAEQVSPQSSYRSSVKSIKVPVLPRPTILPQDDDTRSEGGRSSIGSNRASPSLRKFSAVTRSVISSKRVFSSMGIPATKPKA